MSIDVFLSRLRTFASSDKSLRSCGNSPSTTASTVNPSLKRYYKDIQCSKLSQARLKLPKLQIVSLQPPKVARQATCYIAFHRISKYLSLQGPCLLSTPRSGFYYLPPM